MANSDKLIRLLKIISIIQNRAGASLNMLVEECEVSERTIYRDISALAEGGMPVFYDTDARRYRFMQAVYLKPLTFSVDEASAIIHCIKGFAGVKTPLAASLRLAQEKIMSCLPTEQQKVVDQLRDVVDIKIARQPHEVCGNTFDCVGRSIHSRRRVLVEYYTKTTETRKERKLDPYLITFRGKAWYLVAFCHLREAIQVFRLDRILKIKMLGESFSLPANFSASAYFEGSWLLEQGDPVKVKLKFYPEAARWVRDSSYHPAEKMQDTPDGGLIYEVTVNGTREITRWFLGYGPDVEVLEPQWLRQDVAAMCKAVARLY